MIRHYVTAVVRSLMQHRLYGFINIAGLSVALACAYRIQLSPVHFPGSGRLRLGDGLGDGARPCATPGANPSG